MAIDLAFRRRAVRTVANAIGCSAPCDLDQVPIYAGQSVDGVRSRVNRHLTLASLDVQDSDGGGQRPSSRHPSIPSAWKDRFRLRAHAPPIERGGSTYCGHSDRSGAGCSWADTGPTKAAREGPETRPERPYAKRSVNDIASAISGISGVGAKPSSAGARTAWASAGRPVDW